MRKKLMVGGEKNLEWKIVECDLRSLVAYLKGNTNKNLFDPTKPHLVIYQFKSLNWTGVVKIAPQNSVLWATEIRGHNEYKIGRRWSNKLLNNEEIYLKFNKELLDASLDKENVPWSILGPYCQWGEYLGKANSAFRPISLTKHDYVASGVLIPNAIANDVIDYYKQQISEFSNLSFWHLNNWDAEGVVDRLELRYGFKDAKLFRATKSIKSSGQLEEYCEKLNHLSSLSNGELHIELHYEDAVRPIMDFDIEAITSQGDIELEILKSQAKLVRKLGWPNIYNSISSIPDFWSKLEKIRSEDNCVMLFKHELLEFKSDVEKRYPVLLDNPLIFLN